MEVTALCIRLLMNVLFLLPALLHKVDSVSLQVIPNKLQFFEYESLTFHCEGFSDSTGLKVVNFKGEVRSCKTASKLTSTGLFCTHTNLYPEDSGVYWCEDGGGKRSNSIKITVTAGSVILESPVLPVMEGDVVTLRCRNKTSPSILTADFYKDGLLISSSSTEWMIIPSVSRSDEGLYKCRISDGGESALSLLTVRAGDRRREKKAQGCNFRSEGERWDRTAPTPESEASTSTTNCAVGSGWDKTGAETNKDFNLAKATSASGIHTNGTFTEVSLVKGVATLLMEVTALCIRLLMNVLFLLPALLHKVDSVSLQVIPNKLQFFEYESLTFHCEGFSDSTGLKVVNFKGEVRSCKTASKLTSTGLSCTQTNLYPEDSGVYWCEDGGGKRSNSIKITVTAGSVILESPVLPVMEGDVVTLRCRNKTSPSILTADFYKDGLLISSSSTEWMIIPSVSRSDEGLYKCRISDGGESALSLLTVREAHNKPEPCASSSPAPWIIVTVLLVVLLSMVGLLHIVKCPWHRAWLYLSTLTPGSGSAEVQTGSY
ncbi:Fc receptor-like protein 5 [Chaetodon trifascialis]|uniref:Fc receptor-like protein 5 n=1 Tax=Chaetodon trifascialis TaxID=109706 RepID=UPI003996036F